MPFIKCRIPSIARSIDEIFEAKSGEIDRDVKSFERDHDTVSISAEVLSCVNRYVRPYTNEFVTARNDDILKLNGRVSASQSELWNTVVVHHHSLRHAINWKRVRQAPPSLEPLSAIASPTSWRMDQHSYGLQLLCWRSECNQRWAFVFKIDQRIHGHTTLDEGWLRVTEQPKGAELRRGGWMTV